MQNIGTIRFSVRREEPYPSVRMDVSDDVTYDELLDAFIQFSLGLGYQPDTVQQTLQNRYPQIVISVPSR